MGEIYIKGHGRFNVAGDKPTTDELKQIKEVISSPEYKGSQVEKKYRRVFTKP